ncbi:hypothetical protein ABIF68_008890 [Bradyrhizobium japonicum]|uniref:hypothetical protein n=1 Tax=Bradyrhizobium sp. Mp27 TaxID=3042157 RepID=UPI00248CB410|nr:hypothetical protein [Bradyrhizobium sp. Mp27]MDI2077362.1 hypothetical protein [Bradyrhizobium sp. Mp27]
MTSERQIVELIERAEEVCGPTASLSGAKPRLLVENCNPDRTVAGLRDLLAGVSCLYDRGFPVRLAFDQLQQGTVAQMMTPDALVLTAHMICRPYALKTRRDGEVEEVDARLPRSLAVMYLDWRGEWKLPPLNGIASAPQLREDGTINSTEGYDTATGMWCENVPDLSDLVPAKPSLDEAAAALRLIRETFKTFCFADAETIGPAPGGVATVDTSKAPGRDESSFLAALLTAVCRPSLHLAPGVLLRAAPVSGAGAGKGLLARCISIVAFGREPHAVTGGASAEELEKRISAELMRGGPSLFLDNLNNTAFKSDLLASAITERPARVRLLGQSQMVALNASAFVILTGNGLTVSEDLARRFVTVEFDARTEDPELRPFAADIRLEVTQRRKELLAATLTIWRWGRTASGIKPGLPIGSFAQWCRWVRDPLLALGCQEPVARLSESKQRDGRRQVVADLFVIWWAKHQDRPVTVRELHDEVRQALDPQGRGRQYVASQAEKLAGIRMAGFVLSRQAPSGKWGAATYSLKQTGEEERHRGHRGHRGSELPPELRDTPYAPYAPYASYAYGGRTVIMDGPSGSDGAVSAKPSVAGDVEVADSSAPPTLEKSETVGWSTRL